MNPCIIEKVFEIDGVTIKVLTGVSGDKKAFELSMEAGFPLEAIYVAKILEVVGSSLIKNVYIPPQMYAKEMI